MKHTPRLFSCALCLDHTVICSYCDRGQIYCGAKCAQIARRKNCREAEKRYQNTFNGKMKHAARQRRYRERIRKKVTDHSSHLDTQDALLRKVKNIPTKLIIKHETGGMRCSFCRNNVLSFLRRGFLRHKRSSNVLLLYSKPP